MFCAVDEFCTLELVFLDELELEVFLEEVEEIKELSPSLKTSEEISEDKPNESTTIENTTNSIITTKVELFSTSYEIVYDETHTMEDLNKLVIDYIEYLAYLEKWNGELPDVVSGDNVLSIIVPQN